LPDCWKASGRNVNWNYRNRTAVWPSVCAAGRRGAQHRQPRRQRVCVHRGWDQM